MEGALSTLARLGVDMEQKGSVPAGSGKDEVLGCPVLLGSSSEVKCSFGDLEEEPSYLCPLWKFWETHA